MKRLVLLLIRISGVVALLRFLNRRKVTILMLHGVAGEHPEAGWAPLWPRTSPAERKRSRMRPRFRPRQIALTSGGWRR